MEDFSELATGAQVEHENYGKGTVVSVSDFAVTINFKKGGVMDVTRRSASLLTLLNSDDQINFENMNQEELKDLIRDVIEEYSGLSKPIELGDRWKGGKMVLQPANPSQKSKEIPMETFFHKIVMVRDRLRVLEQNINSHEKLSDEEKVNLQQYITRIYGSLTTFNILFADQDDQFVGEKTS